jgi:hypothetical protein
MPPTFAPSRLCVRPSSGTHGGLRIVLAAVVLLTLGASVSPLLARDCNLNGVEDALDIENGTSEDCDSNGVPDACDAIRVTFGNHGDGVPLRGTEKATIVVDLNGDQRLDLVVGTWKDRMDRESRIHVSLGHGLRDFAPGPTFETTNLLDLEVADLNGDGDVDLLALSVDRIELYRGDGTGNFGAPEEMVSLTGAGKLAVRDVDLDGSLDLVTLKQKEGTVIWFRNLGEARFGEALAFPVFDRVGSLTRVLLVPGDFDGDADVDFALGFSSRREITVLATEILETGNLANGEGGVNLAVAHSLPAGGVVNSVVAGDLNGDGVVDLVGGASSGLVTVWHSLAGTGFEEVCTLPLGVPHVALGDLDGDGDLELATAEPAGRRITFSLNDGTGRFHASRTVDSGINAERLIAADMDGDGRNDLVAVRESPGRVSVLWSDEESRFFFRTGSSVDLGSATPHGAVSRDLNGDGLLDMALGNGHQHTVAVLLAGVSELATYDLGRLRNGARGWWAAIDAADVDGDGTPDLVTGDSESPGRGLKILFNTGNGRFDEQTEAAAADRLDGVAIADLDGDGDGDLLSAAVTPRLLHVHLNDGSRLFSERVDVELGEGTRGLPWGSHAVVSADFDADGDADVAVANGTSRDVAILRGSGDGAFGDPVIHPILGVPVWLLEVDLDGDGDLDLVTANQDTNDATVLMNQEDGVFAASGDFPIYAKPYSMVTGDFDTDGALDLAAIVEFENQDNRTPGLITILAGTGDGRFRLPFTFLGRSGAGARVALVQDVNGDGRADFVAVGRAERRLTFVLNDAGSKREEPEPLCGNVTFKRGDTDANGTLTVADGLLVLNYLFRRQEPVPCEKSADANDDGRLSLLDPIALVSLLFGRSAGLPEPFPNCGNDPTEDPLECESAGACR